MSEVMRLDPEDIEPASFTSIISGIEGEKAVSYYKAASENKGRVKQAVKDLYKTMEFDLAMKYSKDWDEKRKGDFPVLEMLAENYGTLGESISEGILDNAANVAGSNTLEGSKLLTVDHKDHVIISTVHSAKGLEADVCFVLNVSPKSHRSSYSLGSIDEVEEDRRVLYVALTRAKNELIITRSTESINAFHHQTDKSDSDETKSAYFLDGLPEILVTQQSPPSYSSGVRDAKEKNNIDLDFGMDFS